MTDFLRTLLEGCDPDNGDDIAVDEKVEKEIEECGLPTGTLIECVATNAEISINAALETYQMACIVGGVKVVSEGTGADGAEEVLTEASDNFFGKILAQLKKIKDWFVGIIKKIAGKFGMIGSDVYKKYTKIKPDFDKNFVDGKFKYSGYILDLDKGESVYDKAIDELCGIVTDIVGLSIDEVAEKLKNDPDEMPTQKEIFENIGKAIGKEVKTVEDVTKFLGESLGVSDSNKKENVSVSKSDVNVMVRVIEAMKKEDVKLAKDSIKTMENLAKSAESKVKEAQKRAGEVEGVTKVATETVSIINTFSTMYSSLINKKLSILGAAAKSYVAWMAQVAKGKGNTDGGSSDKKEATEEGMDLSYLFEGADLEDIEDADEEIVEERTYFANLKSMQVWFGDNADAMKQCLKEANGYFRDEEYKKAIPAYEKAKKYCDSAIKELKEIDSDAWTTVFGVFLWGLYYYGIWRLVAHIIVKATAPNIKYKDLDPAEVKRMEAECQKDAHGTQKTIAGVLARVTAFCDSQIEICKHPEKMVAENYDFSRLDNSEGLFESLRSMIEGCESDDDDTLEEGCKKKTTCEGTDLTDLAMSFLS